MNEQEMLAALAANPALLAYMLGQKAGAATTPLALPPHGPGGMLSRGAIEPDIVNAMVMPLQGLEAKLQVKKSMTMNPVYGIFTGLSASTGSEPTAACATPRRPGDFSICNQTWGFGRMSMETKVIRVDNAGQVNDRSEFLDHRLVGNPWANGPTLPITNVTPEQALRNKAANAMLALVTAMGRDYRKLVYTGNPVNTAGSEGYIEYNGLDRIINPGYRDAFTGIACPAADPKVVSFGNALTTADSANTVKQITELLRYLKYTAEQVGLDVTWAIPMRRGLFLALTEVWPCAYLTYRCSPIGGTTGNQVTYNGDEAIKLRDDMRQGGSEYLLIDGEKVPVILDDTITETIPVAGTFQSDIYFVPLTFNGMPATYIEYFDFKGPEGAQSVIDIMKAGGSYQISPDGRFLFHFLPPTYWCTQIAVVTWKRLICRVPFLAARLTNFRYVMSYHERGWDPNDAYYSLAGGESSLVGYQPYLYPTPA